MAYPYSICQIFAVVQASLNYSWVVYQCLLGQRRQWSQLYLLPSQVVLPSLTTYKQSSCWQLGQTYQSSSQLPQSVCNLEHTNVLSTCLLRTPDGYHLYLNAHVPLMTSIHQSSLSTKSHVFFSFKVLTSILMVFMMALCHVGVSADLALANRANGDQFSIWNSPSSSIVSAKVKSRLRQPWKDESGCYICAVGGGLTTSAINWLECWKISREVNFRVDASMHAYCTKYCCLLSGGIWIDCSVQNHQSVGYFWLFTKVKYLLVLLLLVTASKVQQSMPAAYPVPAIVNHWRHLPAEVGDFDMNPRWSFFGCTTSY